MGLSVPALEVMAENGYEIEPTGRAERTTRYSFNVRIRLSPTWLARVPVVRKSFE